MRHDYFRASGARGSGFRPCWRGVEDSSGDKQTTCSVGEAFIWMSHGVAAAGPARTRQAHKESLSVPQDISTANQNRVFLHSKTPQSNTQRSFRVVLHQQCADRKIAMHISHAQKYTGMYALEQIMLAIKLSQKCTTYTYLSRGDDL